jgi:hypothetical protein
MTVIEIKQAYLKGEFTAQRALGEVKAIIQGIDAVITRPSHRKQARAAILSSEADADDMPLRIELQRKGPESMREYFEIPGRLNPFPEGRQITPEEWDSPEFQKYLTLRKSQGDFMEYISRKTGIDLDEMEALWELEKELDAVAPENKPTTSPDEPEPIGKIAWLGTLSGFERLYSALRHAGLIPSCAKSFAAAFIQTGGEPIPPPKGGNATNGIGRDNKVAHIVAQARKGAYN